ncbi:ABC transporter permease, partial [Streptomyces sp. NPDC058171]
MTLADTVLDRGTDAPIEADATDSRIRPRTARRVPGLSLLCKPALLLSVALLLLMIGWALFPEVFTSHDPYVGVPRDKLTPPNAEYWFGTDHLGRDLYTRTVYGTGLSMQATLIAVVVGLFAGSTIGLLSGFIGGKFDDVVMRLVDVLLSIPGLLLSLAVVSVLGFGTVNVAIAVGVASVASFARIMRSDVLRTRTQVFVEAAT